MGNKSACLCMFKEYQKRRTKMNGESTPKGGKPLVKKENREYRDVFAIDGVPALRDFYRRVIFPASHFYRGPGSRTPIEHTVAVPSFQMHMAKILCAELAGWIWPDGTRVRVLRKGRFCAEDPLQRWVDNILRGNAFDAKMREHIAQVCALGGGALKAHVTMGRAKPGANIVMDYCTANQFIPTAWSGAEITAGIFVSRTVKEGRWYTRLEWHKWNGSTYVVTNDLYRTEECGGTRDVLGCWCPLDEAYAHIAPKTSIEGLDAPLFGYYRVPTADMEENLPLGISVYGSALDTLRGIDACYSSFLEKFQPDNGCAGPVQNLGIEEHADALNAMLDMLCMQAGLSEGTFHLGMRPAGKRGACENERTHKTVKAFQNQVAPAVERLVHSAIRLGMLYDMAFEGQGISALAGDGFSVKLCMAPCTESSS